ncbi:cell division protein CrgA [Agreia sp. Leaf283]|uniref:cell division protein CrgA n=1 Tax=Agreia sp. Leaf283 TaxID=1736321 RepID=UPI0007022DC5|nr:cell division protein CrgA [Agreia sp. Leaf283]KQP57789.1 hypothetical protein ASF51_08350 [Agreia sp. Leaf283]
MSQTPLEQPVAKPTTALVVIGVILAVLGALNGVAGLVWIAVFYLSQARAPLPDVGGVNLVIGGVLFLVGIVFAVVAIVILITASRRRRSRAAI